MPDIAKAFDTLNHRFLLTKLTFSGIDGPVLNWIKSFLSDRLYQVQIDGVLSEVDPCHSGVKMVFERPQSSREGMEPTNQPQRVLLPHSWKPPFHLSVFLYGRRQPPNSTGHHRPRPGGSVDMTFTSSVNCREATNTARRLVFMARRSFCEISKAAFIRLYCAKVRPHLEYAMEAKARQ